MTASTRHAQNTETVSKKHTPTYPVIEMKKVASIILGGGEGTRLYPLTLTRSKPAISFGGKYRLIDIPISNSIHAECHKIFILTQFLSSSLHHHIFQTYLQYPKSSGLIEILTAEQKPSQKNWFLGTADAVRQNIEYLLEHPVDYFLILSGDQLYNINFQEMVDVAAKNDADLVIATLPINEREASRMGVLNIDNKDQIIDFKEKPQDQSILETLKMSPEILERLNIYPQSQKDYLGSMGIYLFKRKALVELLARDPREDFGKHLIPTMIQSGKVSAFVYKGYWEDIGTIHTFYQANMSLIGPNAIFSLQNQERPIFSARYNLPPSQIYNSQINQVILCDGATIEADEIIHSIIGPRAAIGKGSIVRDSYIMGSDYYQTEVTDHPCLPVRPHIGENCIILKAIIDKNASLGNGVKLINKQKLTHYDGGTIFIRDGIIIVPRGATLPDDFIL
jgi:glucose-1-phosphate adenylyltransferase